jgi:hypothetical protein
LSRAPEGERRAPSCRPKYPHCRVWHRRTSLRHREEIAQGIHPRNRSQPSAAGHKLLLHHETWVRAEAFACLGGSDVLQIRSQRRARHVPG